ncbi:MAG: BlaI/MecI/CopY family transcriptional regulator [Tepidisphaeraceae bacterium]
MARPKLSRPTDGELEILGIMWRLGDATVRDVHDVMSKGRAVAQTTVDKRMRAMVAKGQLSIVDERRPTRFRAMVDQGQTFDSMIGTLLKKAVSPCQLILHLIRGGKMSAQERQQVRDVLNSMPNDS